MASVRSGTIKKKEATTQYKLRIYVDSANYLLRWLERPLSGPGELPSGFRDSVPCAALCKAVNGETRGTLAAELGRLFCVRPRSCVVS